MSWQRARQPVQKAERVAAILDAAAALFDEKELADISMRDVAERAGLGKASLYHYFKTKEEVFISLYRAELDKWVPDAEKRLNRIRIPTPKRIAKALTDALRDHTRFSRLTVIFSSVLEHNLSPEFICDFKKSLLEPFGKFAMTMQRVASGFTDDAVHDFLFQHHAIIAGLWPLAHPSQEVTEVLKDEQLRGFQVDFYALFQQTVEQLIPDR